MIYRLFLMSVVMVFSQVCSAGKVQYNKTQDVNFDGASIDGQIRTPDGAFINQKRGVKFLPLYKIKKQFDRGIRSSVEYLR